MRGFQQATGVVARSGSGMVGMPATERAFDQIRGCPTLYARGRAPRRATFYCAVEFYEKLERWLDDLDRHRPEWFGGLVSLTSAGAYVNKPGYHGMGRALDIDVVAWENLEIRPIDRAHAKESDVDRRRYVGLDAFCRRWFSWVLDGYFNAPHADHIHVDDASWIGLNVAATSTVKFCQAACNEVYGFALAVDGAWGRRTQEAMIEAQARCGVEGDLSMDLEVWREWLRRTGEAALAGDTFPG